MHSYTGYLFFDDASYIPTPTSAHTHTPFSGAPATIMMINHESFANDLPQKLLEEMSSSKEILSSKLYCLGKSNINLPGKLMKHRYKVNSEHNHSKIGHH